MLDRVDLHGCVVTADALHTQRSHAHYLHRYSGHYVLTVKGNQPALREQCAALPWSQVRSGHVEHAAGHGRRDQRTIQIITAVHLALPFPHARQVAWIVRRRRHGRTGRERTLAVASMLQERGADVVVTDPAALENVRRARPRLTVEPSSEAALTGAELVVLATEWREYLALDPAVVGKLVARRWIIDGRNVLDPAAWRAAGWTHKAMERA